MKKNYEQFLSLQSEYRSIILQLSKLGINLKEFGYVQYCWEEIDYIKKEANLNDPFFGISFKDSIALALACTEEDRNNHVDDYEIEVINKFFNLNVSRNDITEMHSKYI